MLFIILYVICAMQIMSATQPDTHVFFFFFWRIAEVCETIKVQTSCPYSLAHDGKSLVCTHVFITQVSFSNEYVKDHIFELWRKI